MADVINSHATTHAHGHRALQHHFENMEQQREAGTLGMWIFLVTEIMFFGGMFLAYTLYRCFCVSQ
jgi:cytochrome c oxidase subunit 3